MHNCVLNAIWLISIVILCLETRVHVCRLTVKRLLDLTHRKKTSKPCEIQGKKQTHTYTHSQTYRLYFSSVQTLIHTHTHTHTHKQNKKKLSTCVLVYVILVKRTPLFSCFELQNK